MSLRHLNGISRHITHNYHNRPEGVIKILPVLNLTSVGEGSFGTYDIAVPVAHENLQSTIVA